MTQQIEILNYTIKYNPNKISYEWVDKIIVDFDRDIKELRNINYLVDEDFIDYFYDSFDDFFGIESISFVNMNLNRGTTTIYFNQNPVIVFHQFDNKNDEDLHARYVDIAYGASDNEFDENDYMMNYDEKSFDEL